MNRFVFLLNYAKRQGKNGLTLRELFDTQDEAVDENLVRKDEICEEVLSKYGWTLERWRKEVLLISGQFYFAPKEEWDLINEDLRKALKAENLLDPQVLYSFSVFSGQLSSYFRKVSEDKREITRTKNEKGLWVYQLK